MSRIKLLAYGGIIYIGASTAAYLYVKSRQMPPCLCDHAPTTTAASFNKLADVYDNKINMDETLMGIKLLRRFLIRHAQGKVLEVSAGTGRNMKYYDKNSVHELTLTDMSRDMLLKAYEKYEIDKDMKVRFALADVEHLVAAADDDVSVVSTQQASDTKYGPALKHVEVFPASSIDTIVDTFGLCSCENPTIALQQMASALKPGGKLLLLEHGRSSWSFINKILDENAEKHLQKWGCEWNRPIDKLVLESGLVIESISRWHFGTTYVIHASKASG